MALFAVILAGGSGTRFWPASRRLRPKQLLALGPDREASLIDATVRHIETLCPPERILVATGAHLLEATRRALPGLPQECFLAEPVPRNTAACIGWAAALIRRRDRNAVVMVLPSDQHVRDEPAFQSALQRAVQSATTGPITTIGIAPTRPETGYGYIEVGACLGEGLYRAVRFVEKPDLQRAERYLASGRYYWNGGMFFFRVDVLLAAIRSLLPTLYRGLEQIDSAAQRGHSAEQQETALVFESLSSVSIDYGVMERLSELNVVTASFGWSDLGSWQTAWELADKDAQGNVLDVGSLAFDCAGCLVRNLRTNRTGRVTAVVGVDGLCVVETDDALLIIPRERAQDVRLVVEALQQRGQSERL
jgi:mannose-1-phosphate guanylyltransferase